MIISAHRLMAVFPKPHVSCLKGTFFKEGLGQRCDPREDSSESAVPTPRVEVKVGEKYLY